MASDSAFFAGVCSALAVVHMHDQSVIFDEIVRSVGEELLLDHARRSGTLKWSGLSDYKRRHQGEADER